MKRDLIRMALILGLMSAVGPFAIDMYLPSLPSVAGDLGAPVSAAQMTLMSFFVSFAISQLFYGPAADMFGRKPPIYFGLVLFAAASIGCAVAPSIEWLIAMRFLQGLGAAAVMSIPRAIIRDLYTGVEATRLMSTIMLVISVSPMLAPLFGSAIIVPFGWRAVFVALTVATAMSLALTVFALPETLHPADKVPFRLSAMLAAFRVLIRDPAFMGLTLIGGFGFASFSAFLSMASFLYTEHYGLTPVEFSFAFAANALGFFASSQFAANLGARFGSVNVVRWSVLGYAASASLLFAVFLAGVDSFALLVLVLVIGNGFMGLVIPTAMVLSLEEHGEIAGSAAALGGTLQMVLGVAVMGISSVIFNGTPLPMVAIIAACALAALLFSVVTLRGRATAAA